MTTAALLFLYGAWMVRGVVLGARERAELDTVYPARVNFVTTKDRWVLMQGSARLHTLRSSVHDVSFVCPTVLSVRCDDQPTAELHVDIEVEDVPPTAHLVPPVAHIVVTDGVTGRSHWINELRSWRVRNVIPLPRSCTSLLFESRPPGLALRVTALRLVAPASGATFASTPQWQPLLDTGEVRVSLGSGWWPRGPRAPGAPPPPWGEPFAPDEPLYMCQDAYLLVEPKVPGPCWMSVPCKKLHVDYPDPIVQIDDRAPNDVRVTPFATSVVLVAFAMHLTASNVMSIRHSGPIYSPRDLNGGPDARDIGYGIMFGRWDWVQTR